MSLTLSFLAMALQHPFTMGQYIATWIGVVALLICGVYPFAFPQKVQRNAIRKYERRSPALRRFMSLSYLKSRTHFWQIRILGALVILMAVFLLLGLLGAFGKFEISPGI